MESPEVSTQFNKSRFASSFLAAGSSSVVLMTAVAPIERVKLLLQNQDASSQIAIDKRYKSATDCFRRIIREQGFFSLWRGYFVTVLRYFPSKVLGFTIFNHCKAYSDSSLVGNMLVGAFAGCTTTVAFYPLGLARTRLGVDVGKTGADRQFNNLLDCLAKILKSDGPAGLYRGAGDVAAADDGEQGDVLRVLRDWQEAPGAPGGPAPPPGPAVAVRVGDDGAGIPDVLPAGHRAQAHDDAVGAQGRAVPGLRRLNQDHSPAGGPQGVLQGHRPAADKVAGHLGVLGGEREGAKLLQIVAS
eukprot:CAMPEP_0168330396 /NCGR_PEP_ID=MMETSP0213-20121227/7705_1 /TAXON_ID=151035 /ORGANISM="Euplotes harpa, Strain FSP1.4" /LENGTH=300 /DNA_ID=CAMNT_0008333957 /DNA_START=9 /DNA_END=910 /DNA_ORIENTATION=-